MDNFVSLKEYIVQREREIKREREYEYSPQWYKDKALECQRIAKLNRAFYRKHG